MPQASWYSKDAIKRAKAKKAKPPITKAMKDVGLKPGPLTKHYEDKAKIVNKLKKLS